jgi:hypothetical protein
MARMENEFFIFSLIGMAFLAMLILVPGNGEISFSIRTKVNNHGINERITRILSIEVVACESCRNKRICRFS